MGCEKPFVDRTNKAIEKIKQESTDAIVNAIHSAGNSGNLVADEFSLVSSYMLFQDPFEQRYSGKVCNAKKTGIYKFCELTVNLDIEQSQKVQYTSTLENI